MTSGQEEEAPVRWTVSVLFGRFNFQLPEHYVVSFGQHYNFNLVASVTALMYLIR